jgi:hypothetical protein
MNTTKKLAAVLATAALASGVLGAPASGRADGSRRLDLTEPAMILGINVPSGSYMLSWTREKKSEEVRISLVQGKQVLATGKGRWIEFDQPSRYEALVYRPETSGASGLAEIRFRASCDAIEINTADAVAHAAVNGK